MTRKPGVTSDLMLAASQKVALNEGVITKKWGQIFIVDKSYKNMLKP
jgi:hypothetical protein